MTTYRARDRSAVAGTLLVLGLVALGAAIFYLDVIQRALLSTYRIHVLLRDAPGVRPGTPVTVAGIEVGWVTRVALAPVNSGRVAKIVLTLELRNAVRSQVRRDSEVRLREVRLLGDPVVDVVPGSLAADVLAPGDTLRSPLRPDAAAVLARARDLGAAYDSLRSSALRLGLAWQATWPAAAAAARRLSAAQTELRRLDAAYQAGPLAARLQDAEWPSTLRRTRTAAAEIRSLFRRGSGSPDPAALGPALARLAAQADTLMHEFRRIEAALATPGGIPAPAGRDTALARALRAARAELDSLVAETRRNPLRFFF